MSYSPRTSAPSSSASGAITSLYKSYNQNTPARLKLIDALCAFLMLLGVMQFVYCIAVTNFPFNSFIAGCVLFSTPSRYLTLLF